jgi:hypothetical protein
MEGVIKSFQPPALHPVPCNGLVELEDGRSLQFLYHYQWTRFDIPGLKLQNRANSPDDYQKILKPGMRVAMTYSPFSWEGSLPRLMTLGLAADSTTDSK